jgi:hypothetical protein
MGQPWQYSTILDLIDHWQAFIAGAFSLYRYNNCRSIYSAHRAAKLIIEPLDELKLLQDSFFKFATNYLNFFTWFFGLNILAVTAVISTKDVANSYISLVSYYALSVIVLGFIGSLGAAGYSNQVRRRALRLLAGQPDAEIILNGIFATKSTRISILTICLCHPLMFVLWVGILVLKSSH